MTTASGTLTTRHKYDVAIVGAGVCGAALAHVLRRYTNVGSIALVEKCSEAASVNSASWNNSQTLHFGDIETNYNLEKSRKVNRAATRVRRYLEVNDPEGELHTRYHKMVLGVGEEECQRLEQRMESHRETFPDLELIERDRIAELEPALVEGRDPEQALKALFSPDGYAVDYGKLARFFIKQAKQQDDEGSLDLYFDRKVERIEPIQGGDGGYLLKVRNEKPIQARFLVAAAGGHSLLMAKQLGYGRHLGLLSVAGSFYEAERKLNGKVYTMQVKGLPFAAPHGDPEVHEQGTTRFGPTAKPLPLLERRHYASFWDYWRTLGFGWNTMASLLRILSRPIIFRFADLNSLYEVPVLGKRLFLGKVRKIVPGLKPADIRRARGYGGVRPQIVDTRDRDLDMGEAKIEGKNARFVITPSPGASVCLQSASEDAQAIADALGGDFSFDRDRFEAELGA